MRSTMSKVFAKICSITSTVLVVLVIAIAAVLYIPQIFGAKPYYVLSGSMSPTFYAGSVIYVNESVKPEDLKEGDVLTFNAGGNVVTHRIIEIEKDGDKIVQFVTKGDANKNTTEIVLPTNIIGRATNFGIPLLGYVTYMLQQPWGKFVLIGIAAVVILMMVVPSIFSDDDDEDKKKEDEDEKQEGNTEETVAKAEDGNNA